MELTVLSSRAARAKVLSLPSEIISPEALGEGVGLEILAARTEPSTEVATLAVVTT